MDLQDSQSISASRERAWEALYDPENLRRPQSLEKDGDGAFAIRECGPRTTGAGQ